MQYNKCFDSFPTFFVWETNNTSLLHGRVFIQYCFNFCGPHFISGCIDHSFKTINHKEIPLFIHSNNIPCTRSEEHTSELQSRGHLVCRLLLEKKNQ